MKLHDRAQPVGEREYLMHHEVLKLRAVPENGRPAAAHHGLEFGFRGPAVRLVKAQRPLVRERAFETDGAAVQHVFQIGRDSVDIIAEFLDLAAQQLFGLPDALGVLPNNKGRDLGGDAEKFAVRVLAPAVQDAAFNFAFLPQHQPIVVPGGAGRDKAVVQRFDAVCVDPVDAVDVRSRCV